MLFLSDATVAENIAFGVPATEIDLEKVKIAAHMAQISDLIMSWNHQFSTRIGERGIKLSGGQRQRIGIARALYKSANVLIFDEATSSLDGGTEKAVMDIVNGLNKDVTVLIVAHRLTTLKSCTQIVEFEAGKIKRIGSYKELIDI
jgi:ATP-binding cassette subfamily B protein